MSYIDKNLRDDEEIVLKEKISLFFTLKPLIFLICCLCFFDNSYEHAIILIFLAWLTYNLINRWISEFGITTKRLFIVRSFISREIFDLSLQKIESCEIQQGVFGRFFNYGTIVIIGAGASRKEIKGLHGIVLFQNAVYDAKDSIDNNAR